MNNKLFKNREDSSNKLLDILPISDMSQEEWIVLATSSGGVPLAFDLANKLDALFDFMFTCKINAPKNDECEIAIITETQEIIIHEELMKAFNISIDDIYDIAKKQYNTNIQHYIKKYRDGKSIISMQNKNVLFVDEGLNTGLTMMACIKSAISAGAKSVVVAVPILPEVTTHDLESIADDLYYVKAPAHFVSIDFYYENLEDIDLKMIQKIINIKKEN